MTREYQQAGIEDLEHIIERTKSAKVLREVIREVEEHRKLTARLADLLDSAESKLMRIRRQSKLKKKRSRAGSDEACPDCKKRSACGKAHVYVIELPAAAAKDQKLKGQRGGNPLYVGFTHHKVSCVLKEHRAAHDRCKTFECRCFGKTVERKVKGRSLTGKYGVKKLRPDLMAELNPVEDGPHAEEALARLLRREFKVYFNGNQLAENAK